MSCQHLAATRNIGGGSADLGSVGSHRAATDSQVGYSRARDPLSIKQRPLAVSHLMYHTAPLPLFKTNQTLTAKFYPFDHIPQTPDLENHLRRQLIITKKPIMVQIRLASISIKTWFLTVMVLLLFISNSPTPCEGSPVDSDTTAQVDLHPRTPAQLSTGASIAPRSPMPKKKGGGGRGGRGGRPGTGGIKGGGDRGLRTVGGGGGVGDPRLTGERPGTGTARPGAEGGRGDRGRGLQTGGERRPTHVQGSAHDPLRDGNGGRNGVPGSRGRCPDGRRRVNGQCPTS
ncbi:hypothetical protein KEM48_013643 [Puccinia striiformis f. sp. tritici PST-130]|nr:hypothetical protein KEM48_013643 [Puccinia striiformis f. sp. tritici PST-130]